MNIFDAIKYLPLVVQFIREITVIVKEAEKMFKGKGAGKLKKQFVLDTLHHGMVLLSELGGKSYSDINPDGIRKWASVVIDSVVTGFNDTGFFKHLDQ